jgi:hypothetical protein
MPTAGCLSCRERLARSRGLCPACYDRAARAVRAGETTWAELEAAGRALPAVPTGQRWRRWSIGMK